MRKWMTMLLICLLAGSLAAPGAMAATPDPGVAAAGNAPALAIDAEARPLVSGVVTDRRGQPVPEAEVEVHRLGTGLIAVVRTGPDGRFTVPDREGAAGLYRLRVHAPGYRVRETPWTNLARERYLTLRLERLTGSLQIALRDEEGRRLAGSALLLGPGGRLVGELRSESGQFVRDQLPTGTYRVLLMAAGHRAEERQVTIRPGQTASLAVTMVPTGLVVSGEVRDAVTGDPIPSGRVELIRADRTLFASAPVGSDGRFLLTLPRAEEESYAIRVTAPGYRAVETSTAPMSGGRAYDFSGGEAIALQPLTGAIRGTLLSRYGFPLKETRVVLHLQGYGTMAETQTDDEGRFAFPEVPAAPGLRYRVSADEVWDPTASDWTEVLPGLTTELLVRSAEGSSQTYGFGSLSGLVTDHRGAPVTGATVELIRNGRVEHTATTLDDGSFLLTEVRATRSKWQDATPYTLRVSLPGYLPTQEVEVAGQKATSVHVTEDGRTSVRVVLRPAAPNLRGRVLDGDGRAVQGAQVELLTDGHLPVQTVTTDVGGWYELSDVALRPTGTYSLRVRADGFRPVSGVDVTEAAREGSALPTVRLTARAVTFTGQVRGLDGNPLEAVRLILRGAGGQVLAEGRTDADGFYRLETGRPDGPLVLVATLEGYREAAAVITDDLPGTRPSANLTTNLVLAPATAGLTGRVLDESGRPVGYAQVALVQEGRGVVRTVTALGSGLYRFENVPVRGSGWFWLRVQTDQGTFAGSYTHSTEMVPLLRLVPGHQITVDLRVRRR